MRLNDLLVDEVVINNKTIELDLTFDNVLDIFDVLNDRTLLEWEKLDMITSLLVNNDVELDMAEQADLFAYVRERYIDSDSEAYVEYDLAGNPIREESERLIDFEQDAEFIYASFLRLGINLFKEQGKLTWMEFKAILNSLPEDSKIVKVMQIRSWEPQEEDTQDYRREMYKLQKVYALKDREEVNDV